MSDTRAHLCRLYEKTSQRGRRYLTGRLGYARILAFAGEPLEDGTTVWNVYIAPVDQNDGGAGPRTERPTAARERVAAPPAMNGRAAAFQRPAAPAGDDDSMDWERGDPEPF